MTRCLRCLPGVFLCPTCVALWGCYLAAQTDAERAEAWEVYSEHLGVEESDANTESRGMADKWD